MCKVELSDRAKLNTCMIAQMNKEMSSHERIGVSFRSRSLKIRRSIVLIYIVLIYIDGLKIRLPPIELAPSDKQQGIV